MKKALAILAALALVASAASAEITIGGWGRGIFAVSNSGADNATTWVGNMPSWDWGGKDAQGAGGARIGVTLAGSADKVGFQIDLNGDGGSINAGDQQLIWAKPVDMIKLSLGRVQVDTLRGNAGFGSYNWYRAYGESRGIYGEDFIFFRLSTGIGANKESNNRQGMIIEITPVEGLFIGVALRNVTGTDVNDGSGTDKAWHTNQIDLVLPNGQYQVGYTIAGIGTIRAQYIGLFNYDTGKNVSDIEAAFKLTAVENLYADIGYHMDLADNSNKLISLYANYKAGAATIHALGRLTLPSSGDMGMYFGAGLDYGFDGGIGINADVRYANKVDIAGANDRITFMLGVTESLGNGLVGIAFEGSNAAKFGFSVPVRFEYCF